LKVSPLADEWGSSKGGISTLNRELCIGLAQQPNVVVTLVVSTYDETEKQAALNEHKVHLAAPDFELPGYDSVAKLAFPPADLAIDVVIGHGRKLGPPANVVAKQRRCKRVHIVHTASEQIAMYKNTDQAIADGDRKHQIEVDLSKTADVVVGIGPKLTENIKVSLRAHRKDGDVLDLTPGIFSEFSELQQASADGKSFYTLVFGRGDYEDFELKGYDIAAKAVAGLKDKTYQLVFVGAPEGKEEEVKENLLKCGISPTQLTVRGFRESREKLGEQFSQADLAIMPSRTEGFGLAALEALSAGLPILVSDNSGLGIALAEIPSGTASVVYSDEPRKWGEAIELIRKKPRAIRLKEASNLRSSYDQRFKWQEQCAALVEKIRDVM